MTRRIAVILLAAGMLALAHPALAVPPDQASWVSGTAAASCGSGPNRWLCTYTLNVTGCTEVSTSIAPCHATVTATVAIAPIVNAAGQNIGCTSIAGDAATTGNVSYDSFFPAYDNGAINSPFAVDVRGGGSTAPAEVTYAAAASGGALGEKRWVASGSFLSTCARGSSTTTTNTGTSPGSVTAEA